VVCRATIREDFNTIISQDGRLYNLFKINKNEGTFTCKLTGSVILFEGCDSQQKVLGMRQDFAFFNEVSEIQEDVYNQIDQRTAYMLFCDYNPSKKFFLDKYQKNPNTLYIHSTFKDNPFLPQGIIDKLKSYNPDDPVNVQNGTANPFMWKVYGLGTLAEKPNRVYKTFPKCTPEYYNSLEYKEYFGLDFGSSVPTAIVGVKFDGDRTFFVRQIMYTPGQRMGVTVPKYVYRHCPMISFNDELVCDSAKLRQVNDMTNFGFNAIPALKGPGSFLRGVSLLQGVNIIITTDSLDIEEENSGYEYKLDRYGIVTDDVIQKDDHLLDAMRYAITYIVNILGIRI
jgi:phage terminase large subunit